MQVGYGLSPAALWRTSHALLVVSCVRLVRPLNAFPIRSC